MRMLMKWTLGTREASEAIRSGCMADVNKTLDELTKPEAQYFGTEGGSRTGYVSFDLADPSDIPPIAEPLFQELNATVEFIPVMNVEALQRGLAQAAQAEGANGKESR